MSKRSPFSPLVVARARVLLLEDIIAANCDPRYIKGSVVHRAVVNAIVNKRGITNG